MTAALPFYVSIPPSEYAEKRKEQTLRLGCSKAYAERVYSDVLARTVSTREDHRRALAAWFARVNGDEEKVA